MRAEAVDELARQDGRALSRGREGGIFELDVRLERPDDDAARGVFGGGEDLAKRDSGAGCDERADDFRERCLDAQDALDAMLGEHPVDAKARERGMAKRD